MKMRWAIFVFILFALLVSAVQPVLAQEEIEQHGLRFDAPAYAIDGPYTVGVRYYTIPARTDKERGLTATVWYPALNPDVEAAEFVYEQNFEPGQLPPFTVIGHAALDAEMDDSAAPYPLVVYSHAHWSMGQELPYLIEHLASLGFIVISVDHEDNWSTDFGPMAYEAHVRRPQEVTRQIDFAESLSESGGDLEGMIATEKVGIAGWSMGGGTALAAAGASIDTDNLRSWCEKDPSHVQATDWACVDMLDHEEEMAEFAGLSEVPTGLWPDWGDERIAAVVSLSGSSPQFGAEGFATVDVPVMLMHGGHEAMTDPGVTMGQPFESLSTSRKSQVVFNGAGHFVFFSSCDESPDIYNISQEMGFPTFCADDVWDMDRAHDLINHFATAFLSAELKGDEAGAAALAPEAVDFPGIEYRAEGFAAEPPEAELVRRWLHLWDTMNGDMDDFDEIVSEDFVSHNMPEGNREVMRAGIEGFRADNPGAYFPLEELAISDGKAYITNSMWMMPEGAQEGDEGEPVSPPFLLVLGLEDGQITERWLFVTPE